MYTARTQTLKLFPHFTSYGTARAFITELSILIQGEEVDYRGALHRDGSVLMSVSLDQLKVTFGQLFPCSLLFCLTLTKCLSVYLFVFITFLFSLIFSYS